MAENLTGYQWYGLVGQTTSQVSSSLIQGFGAAAIGDIEAGSYGASAEMLDVRAEQEIVNAQLQANARMIQFKKTEASNVALLSAMGKTAENTTISDANLEAAFKDASLMKRQGKLKSISAKSGASAARSGAKQSKIAGKAASITGILGAIGSVAGAAGAYSMLGGASAPKVAPTGTA